MRLSTEFYKIAAFTLIFCLTYLSVPAQIINSGQKTIVADSPRLSGTLNISDGSEVYVNGNRAQDGMTVLSGAEVETRERGATVALNNLGTVQMCQQTKMNLIFDGERVEIKLASGNARLELNSGAGGEILTPIAGNLTTDAGGIAVTPNYDDINCGCKNRAAPDVPVAGFPGIFSILGIAGGAVAAVIIGKNINDEEGLPTSISNVVP